jgi:hypothetical protein
MKYISWRKHHLHQWFPNQVARTELVRETLKVVRVKIMGMLQN